MNLLPLGEIFSADKLGVLIPIIALMIPIVKMLINHQQKMTELIHSQSALNSGMADAQRLNAEVQSLRNQMNSQVLQIDTLEAKLAQTQGLGSLPGSGIIDSNLASQSTQEHA